MLSKIKFLLAVFCLGLLVFQTGCAKTSKSLHPHHRPDAAPKRIPCNLDKIPNAKPRVEPLSRYGNKFKKGNSYVTKNKRYTVMQTSKGYRAKGLASWYGTKFHGRRTSSGEPYDMFAMTAAHRTLPLPTYAKITNLQNGKSVIVKVNDRGPFHGNRLLDLSYAAAHKLGVLATGTAPIEIVSVDPRDHHGLPKHLLKSKQAAHPLLDKNPQRLSAKTAAPLPLAKNTNTSALKTKTLMGPKLYLQMGSFSSRKNAKEMVNKLSTLFNQASHPILINEKVAGKASNFQVRIGPIANDQEAIRLTQKMARSKLPPPVVIRE